MDEIGGEAVCFGREDDSGKLQPPTVSTYVQIITGSEYACGLLVDQTVECWGSFGKNPIPGMFTQIVGTTFWACGIMIDKQISCFGHLPAFVPPKNDIGYVQISCSDDHCCALDTLGVPSCWGAHNNDQKSKPFMRPPRHARSIAIDGETTASNDEDGYDDEGEDLSSDLVQMKQISVSHHYSCGITLDNDIHCWGTEKRFLKQIKMNITGPFKQLSVGGAGVCGIYGEVAGNESVKTDGPRSHSLECWGTEVETMLGAAPAAVRDLQWDQVIVHKFSMCGVTMQSDLKCFGPVWQGQSLPEDLIIA